MANRLPLVSDGESTRLLVAADTLALPGPLSSTRSSTVQTTLASTATPAFDPSTQGNSMRMVLTANVTGWTVTSGLPGERIIITWIQDGVGARLLVGTPANVKLLAGAITLSVGASAVDKQMFEWDNTLSAWYEISRTLNIL